MNTYHYTGQCPPCFTTQHPPCGGGVATETGKSRRELIEEWFLKLTVHHGQLSECVRGFGHH